MIVSPGQHDRQQQRGEVDLRDRTLVGRRSHGRLSSVLRRASLEGPGLALLEVCRPSGGQTSDPRADGLALRREGTRRRRPGPFRWSSLSRPELVPPGEQEVLEPPRLGQGEVGEGSLTRAPARDVHPELGEAEQPRDEGLHDVDPLQPVDPDPPRLAAQHARVHAQLVGLDPERRAQPRRGAVRRSCEQQQPEQRGRRPELTPRDVADDRPRGSDQHDEAPDQRGQGREPLRRPVGHGPLCHRPAAWDSPRSVSRSRSHAASSAGRPGIRALVRGLAVWSRTLAMP